VGAAQQQSNLAWDFSVAFPSNQAAGFYLGTVTCQVPGASAALTPQTFCVQVAKVRPPKFALTVSVSGPGNTEFGAPIDGDEGDVSALVGTTTVFDAMVTSQTYNSATKSFNAATAIANSSCSLSFSGPLSPGAAGDCSGGLNGPASPVKVGSPVRDQEDLSLEISAMFSQSQAPGNYLATVSCTAPGMAAGAGPLLQTVCVKVASPPVPPVPKYSLALSVNTPGSATFTPVGSADFSVLPGDTRTVAAMVTSQTYNLAAHALTTVPDPNTSCQMTFSGPLLPGSSGDCSGRPIPSASPVTINSSGVMDPVNGWEFQVPFSSTQAVGYYSGTVNCSLTGSSTGVAPNPQTVCFNVARNPAPVYTLSLSATGPMFPKSANPVFAPVGTASSSGLTSGTASIAGLSGGTTTFSALVTSQTYDPTTGGLTTPVLVQNPGCQLNISGPLVPATSGGDCSGGPASGISISNPVSYSDSITNAVDFDVVFPAPQTAVNFLGTMSCPVGSTPLAVNVCVKVAPLPPPKPQFVFEATNPFLTPPAGGTSTGGPPVFVPVGQEIGSIPGLPGYTNNFLAQVMFASFNPAINNYDVPMPVSSSCQMNFSGPMSSGGSGVCGGSGNPLDIVTASALGSPNFIWNFSAAFPSTQTSGNYLGTVTCSAAPGVSAANSTFTGQVCVQLPNNPSEYMLQVTQQSPGSAGFVPVLDGSIITAFPGFAYNLKASVLSQVSGGPNTWTPVQNSTCSMSSLVAVTANSSGGCSNSPVSPPASVLISKVSSQDADYGWEFSANFSGTQTAGNYSGTISCNVPGDTFGPIPPQNVCIRLQNAPTGTLQWGATVQDPVSGSTTYLVGANGPSGIRMYVGDTLLLTPQVVAAGGASQVVPPGSNFLVDISPLFQAPQASLSTAITQVPSEPVTYCIPGNAAASSACGTFAALPPLGPGNYDVNISCAFAGNGVPACGPSGKINLTVQSAEFSPCSNIKCPVAYDVDTLSATYGDACTVSTAIPACFTTANTQGVSGSCLQNHSTEVAASDSITLSLQGYLDYLSGGSGLNINSCSTSDSMHPLLSILCKQAQAGFTLLNNTIGYFSDCGSTGGK
jgi:hypothetical protein